jgi:hypothetical protein
MSPATILLLVAAAGLAALAAVRVLRVWLQSRGARLITCPENQARSAVEVDAGHAAATFLHPELRLQSCSRWPERQGCGQECLRQIESAADGCLVRHIFAGWYEGKHCVYCRQGFENISWADRKPGILTPDGSLMDWAEVKVEEIPETLLTARPVCFSCFTATRFTKEHPGAVVLRPR